MEPPTPAQVTNLGSCDIMRLGEVKGAKDLTLRDPSYEAKRTKARKVMKITRIQMTSEIKGWDRRVAK